MAGVKFAGRISTVFRSVCIVALLGLPVTAHALPDTPDLWDVYARALENDPEFLAALAANRGAQELTVQARAVLLPDVSLSGEATANRRQVMSTVSANSQRRDGFWSGDLTLDLSQPLFRKDLEVALEQAGYQVQQADAQFAAAVQQLMLRVTERYFDVLEQLDGVRFADAEYHALGAQLAEAQSRYDVGLSAITDLQESRSARDLARARLVQARNRLRSSREALREVTGDYRERVAALKDSLPLVAPVPNNIDAWSRTADAGSRDVAAARFNTRSQMAEIRRREAGHLPTVSIVASSGLDVIGGQVGSSNRTWNSSIGLQFSVPLYQGGAITSQVRQALHLHRQALEQQRQTERATDRQTRDAFNGVIAGIEEIDALGQAVESAMRALEAIDAGFRVGTRTATDVVSAQRDLYSAERDYARAKYAYVINLIRLKRAAGTLAPTDLIQLNNYLG